MIAELLMYYNGWDTVWHADVRPHPSQGDKVSPRKTYRGQEWWRFWRAFFSYGPSIYVGRTTGPDGDLVCVRRCDTAEEANRWLSPAGYTILHAALKSLWARYRFSSQGGNL